MKITKKIAVGIIVLFVLMIWSAMVRNVTLGSNSLGPLTEPIKTFSKVPSDMKKTYKYLFEAPDYYLETKQEDEQEVNNLTYDLFGLYSIKQPKSYSIILKNFRDNSIKYQWEIDFSKLNEYYTVDQNDRLYPAALLPNKELIVSCNERPGLIKLDSIASIKWINNDFIYHHAFNFDLDNNIWIPAVKHDEGTIVPNYLSMEETSVYYRDDMIVKVDAKTGQTLYSKSLTEIFMENNLEYVINKSPYSNDPFHLNDIQPVLEDSEYFKQDDLFLSFRHLSLIIQYRPSTGEIIRRIEGPFLFQHDVDIISSTEIAILNNNTFAALGEGYVFDFKPTKETFERKITHSNVLIYNFENDSYSALYENQFISNNIFTNAEGLYEILDNGDLFFEEQNSGVIWVINKNGVVLKTVLKSDIEGYHYLPNWTTTYTSINF